MGAGILAASRNGPRTGAKLSLLVTPSLKLFAHGGALEWAAFLPKHRC
jgi:hypothetical protein